MRAIDFSFAVVLVLAGCGERVELLGSVPAATSSAGGSGSGCAGVDCERPCRLDVVLALQSSDSLEEELAALREEVFPAFALGLLSITGSSGDFRVGVLDGCPSPATLHDRDDDGDACDFEGGNVWIESSTSKLLDELECATDLYTDDVECENEEDEEQPVGSALVAFRDPYATQQNAGFLRPDAGLVLFAATDDDERPTGVAQTAEALEAQLLALKPELPSAVGVVGIGGSGECEGLYGSAEPAALLAELTARFAARGRGAFWDLCSGRLRDQVDRTLLMVRDVCLATTSLAGAGAPR